MLGDKHAFHSADFQCGVCVNLVMIVVLKFVVVVIILSTLQVSIFPINTLCLECGLLC